MVKLSLGNGRFAFARKAEVEAGGAVGGPTVAFEDTMAHAPPQLDLAQMALVTRDGHAGVKGTASDTERLLDAYMFVGSRKFFYRSNRANADPLHMAFEADAPLRPGANVITVVARENPDTTSRKTFIIRRDGPNGELLQSPTLEDDELSESDRDGDDY
jgi:carboxyl-terminal processing protease